MGGGVGRWVEGGMGRWGGDGWDEAWGRGARMGGKIWGRGGEMGATRDRYNIYK